MSINKIAVVGTGLMGKGIVHTFAAYGYKVDVFGRRDDIDSEMYSYLENEVKRGRVTPDGRGSIISNIRFYNINSHIEKLAESDLIIETIKEDLDTKKDIFTIIDKHANDSAIIASNTSGYSIMQLAGFISYPEKFIGLHFFSPVPLMKLVEVVMCEKTDKAKAETICKLVESIEKLPVKVKDSPGFVLNRGLLMLLNEAVYMLYENIASNAEDIDNIFINGMSMKVGPLKLADLIGIDIIYTTISNMHSGFKNDKYTPCPLLLEMVNQGKIGKKAGEGFYKY